MTEKILLQRRIVLRWLKLVVLNVQKNLYWRKVLAQMFLHRHLISHSLSETSEQDERIDALVPGIVTFTSHYEISTIVLLAADSI